MDEIKRALEWPSRFPSGSSSSTYGEREDTWSPRALEFSMTALEHLRAFASPLGVKLLVENLQNDVTRPANILEIPTPDTSPILESVSMSDAHLAEGVASVLAELKGRIRSSHLHDNNGDRDSHLWPGNGTIEWDEVFEGLTTTPQAPAGVLEIHYGLEETPETVTQKAAKAFERF